tara:strand:- start:1180 stop:2079 length:900 start_codon:yes stop_codon:yes gene_type:complete
MSDEVLTSYSGVTLSQDEANSLMGVEPSQPVEQNNEGTEVQPQDSEVSEKDQSLSENEPTTEATEIEVLELDGQQYDMEQLQEAIDAYNNKSEWQKTNTEKSQAISAERKAFDAEIKVWNDLRNDEDAMSALRDVLDADHPVFSNEVAVAEEEPTQDTKESSDRIQELEERLNEIVQVKEQETLDMEADRQVNSDLASLKQEHPELEDQELMDEVITTAIEKGFTGRQGLEDAFVLAYHSASENSAFKTAVNRARSAKAMKSIPETEGNVKGQHTEPVTKAESYKEARQDALKNYNFYE